MVISTELCSYCPLCGALSPSWSDTPPTKAPVLDVSCCLIEGIKSGSSPTQGGRSGKEQDLAICPHHLPNPRARQLQGAQGYATYHRALLCAKGSSKQLT